MVDAGARTTIANAAHSFLHPWTQKGNMAVRLKKLHESAQARHDKSVSWLSDAVANKQQPGLAGSSLHYQPSHCLLLFFLRHEVLLPLASKLLVVLACSTPCDLSGHHRL